EVHAVPRGRHPERVRVVHVAAGGAAHGRYVVRAEPFVVHGARVIRAGGVEADDTAVVRRRDDETAVTALRKPELPARVGADLFGEDRERGWHRRTKRRGERVHLLAVDPAGYGRRRVLAQDRHVVSRRDRQRGRHVRDTAAELPDRVDRVVRRRRRPDRRAEIRVLPRRPAIVDGIDGVVGRIRRRRPGL